MKKFILALALLLSAPMVHADIEGAPFLPESDKRFDALEQGNHIPQGIYPAGSADGHYVRQYVKATYDFAVKGGAVGDKDLAVAIPANAVVTRTLAYSITKPTTSASGTLAFYCGAAPQNSNPNLKASTAAASYAPASSVVNGIQDGVVSNMSIISSACNIKASIATGALTAGKVVLFVDYVVHQ